MCKDKPDGKIEIPVPGEAGGLTFDAVKNKEMEILRDLAGDDSPDYDKSLAGLAFSGGGIRSATFNLGVLQALAERGLLNRFDYLSTVSGGGYIGSWLSAWISRQRRGDDPASARKAALDIQQMLAGSADECTPQGAPAGDAPAASTACNEPKQISFLRRFSNYLTPKLGVLSYDTLAAVATMIRNCLLNQIILILALVPLLLLPREIALLGPVIEKNAEMALRITGALLLWALIWINLNLFDQQRKNKSNLCWYVKPIWIFWLIQIPIVAGAMLAGFLAATLPVDYVQTHWLGISVSILFICVIAWLVALLITRWLAPEGKAIIESLGSWSLFRWNVIGLLAGVCISFVLFILLQRIYHYGDANTPVDHWRIAVWGMPSALGAFALTFTAQVGIIGRPLNEGSREWWGRLGGALIGIVIVWIIVAACALYAPFWMISLYNWVSESVAALGITWVLSSIAGAAAAASAYTGKAGSSKFREIIPRIAPYIFIAGLLVTLSTVLYLGIARFAANPPLFREALAAVTWPRYEWILVSSTSASTLGIAMALSLIAALFFSWRVDINVFSLHNFYKNRLERCYLGASNPMRRDNPFTGFDPNDTVLLGGIIHRPYHIVNTAINLTHSDRLAWQERKAASFVFTPLHCGYELPGEKPVHAYQLTADYARCQNGWISLSRAFAISGAAVSPNMGYHSSPAVAFLLTVFNMRFGRWMENPRDRDVWNNSRFLLPWQSRLIPRAVDRFQPRLLIGLYYLLCELFGAADEKKNFVYLSDGGHFENLGIYELVRRRCRFIVACDAGMDSSYAFEDLGNAVRKCHIDLGVPIKIDTRAIVPDPATGRSRFHCAVGTIQYDHTDPLESPGYLLYIKSSLTGSESIDVKQYSAAHADFPHEPTPDQWFAESQFESYRRLGYKVGRTVFAAAGEAKPDDLETLFESLKQQWCPPSTSTKEAFSKHGDQIKLLHETLRTDKRLEFLSGQFYPEWPVLMSDVVDPQLNTLWLPPTSDERRAGFYFCASLLQLMENVYLDLNLQDEYDHPDNRGWMNLFRHCSWSGMFRATYAITFSTYGARFQQFCRDRFALWEGTVDVTGRIVFQGQSDLEPQLKQAEERRDLNFLETGLIRELQTGSMDFDCIIPLRLRVVNPMPPGQVIQYSFGFALARNRDRKLVYLRVQDHLRKSGLARKASNQLVASGQYAWVRKGEETGRTTPYRKYLESLSLTKRVKFIKQFGDDPDTFQRLVGPVEKKSRSKPLI